MKRIFKQIAYGSLFLIIFFLVGFTVYKIYKPRPTCFDNVKNQRESGVDCGGPCINCELKNLKISQTEVNVFPAGDAKVNLAVKIINPSLNYWAKNFGYTFNVYGRFGSRLKFSGGFSSLAAGETKYIIAPALAVDQKDIKRTEFKIGKIDWRPQEDFVVDQLALSDIKTRLDKQKIEVLGRIENQSPEVMGRLAIEVLFFDKAADLINVSAAELDNLEPFSSRQFGVFLLLRAIQDKDIDLNLTKVFWEIKER